MMASKALATQAIAYVTGTTPTSSSILDYFNRSTSISYDQDRPVVLLIFRSDVFVELKSILLRRNYGNVRQYQIDLIDDDQNIVQTLIINRQENHSDVNYVNSIRAIRITYLDTVDGAKPSNIVLSINACVAVAPSSTTEAMTSSTSTTPAITTTIERTLLVLSRVASNAICI
jgi:hypothetical protein